MKLNPSVHLSCNAVEGNEKEEEPTKLQIIAKERKNKIPGPLYIPHKENKPNQMLGDKPEILTHT